MTITRGKSDKDSQKDESSLRQILGALESAGITDPDIAKKVVASFSKQTPLHAETTDNSEGSVSENALVVLKKRYFLKDNLGNTIENSWSDISRRVARALAKAELLYDPKAGHNIEQINPVLD